MGTDYVWGSSWVGWVHVPGTSTEPAPHRNGEFIGEYFPIKNGFVKYANRKVADLSLLNHLPTDLSSGLSRSSILISQIYKVENTFLDLRDNGFAAAVEQSGKRNAEETPVIGRFVDAYDIVKSKADINEKIYRGLLVKDQLHQDVANLALIFLPETLREENSTRVPEGPGLEQGEPNA